MKLITKFNTNDIAVIFMLMILSIPISQISPYIGNTFIILMTVLWFIATKRWFDFKIRPKDWKRIFEYIFIALIINIIIGLLFTLLDIKPSSENQKAIIEALGKGGIKTYLTIGSVIIFAPIIEEIFFRGMLQEFIGKWNKKIALIITTILFGAVHIWLSFMLQKSGMQIVAELIPYLILSFAFSYYYYKTENLFQCIVMHFINNGWALALYFIGKGLANFHF